MSLRFAELDYRETPMGALSLRRRIAPELDGAEIYEVKLGESFLMSSLFHAAEEALANLVLPMLAGPSDVVVGGLGLGYTAAAALRHENVRSLGVVEVFEAVIAWHRGGLVPLGPGLSTDPRCRFVCADFFALVREGRLGRLWGGETVGAVLLDIDHSPANLLSGAHAGFYAPEGLAAMAAQIQPGGVFGMWADGRPCEAFLRALETAFDDARAEVVPFDNPILGGGSESTVYLARCL